MGWEFLPRLFQISLRLVLFPFAQAELLHLLAQRVALTPSRAAAFTCTESHAWRTCWISSRRNRGGLGGGPAIAVDGFTLAGIH
jgi:hypothetical protein